MFAKRLAFVALSVTVTDAPATSAPEESFTSPVMVPNVCPKPTIEHSSKKLVMARNLAQRTNVPL